MALEAKSLLNGWPILVFLVIGYVNDIQDNVFKKFRRKELFLEKYLLNGFLMRASKKRQEFFKKNHYLMQTQFNKKFKPRFNKNVEFS